MFNNGDGTFASPTQFPSGAYPQWIFVSDVDRDNDEDILVTVNNKYFTVLLNRTRK